MEAFLLGHGVQMALPGDCVAAMMRLACDRSINGELTRFLLLFLGISILRQRNGWMNGVVAALIRVHRPLLDYHWGEGM